MGSPPNVADASALLALVLGEHGADVVAEILPQAVCSAVNWSEFAQKAAQRGVEHQRAGIYFVGLGMTIVPFDQGDAEHAARIWERTRVAGLSLGDRACLALALRLGAPAYTADRSWASLDLGIDIRTIR
ncbi:MAG: PIN domain-containing protein [Chloroflexota bacterium]|nr:MAG: PIN domain-containing protein [Chloroflexota bacterium]